MGFFDKLKEKVTEIKDNNKNFGAAVKRMNNRDNFCGNVNVNVKDGDFVYGSYINLEGNGGVIYSSSQDDYFFEKKDVTGFELIGDGMNIQVGNERKLSLRYLISFADGKKAEIDLLVYQCDKFKARFGL